MTEDAANGSQQIRSETHSTSSTAVSAEALRQVPERIEMLKPGMTLTEALQTLGIDGVPPGTWGSGPPMDYGWRITLNTNRILLLRCDTTQESPIFQSAELFDGQMNPIH